MELQGQVAVITGGGSGIGKAIARRIKDEIRGILREWDLA